MTEYDVLDAETGGAKGEDQGNCCCSVWGEGRRVRTDMWEMEVTALSPMVEGKPCSRKKGGPFRTSRAEVLFLGTDAAKTEKLRKKILHPCRRHEGSRYSQCCCEVGEFMKNVRWRFERLIKGK